MKRGLKLWSLNTENYLPEALRLYEQGVFEYIELYVVPGSLDTLPKWQSVKIPFIVHCPHSFHGFSLAQAEKAETNRAIYQEVKKFADALAAPYIIFHGGIDGNIQETARQLKSFNEPRALIENKPFVAIPNKMGGELCRGFNADEIKCVMDFTGCGFCFDFGHAICAANSLGKEPYAYIDDFFALKPDMYHLTDAEDITSVYDIHTHLGRGQIDLVRLLKKIPNDSYITFETDKDFKDSLKDFEEDMLWVGKVL